MCYCSLILHNVRVLCTVYTCGVWALAYCKDYMNKTSAMPSGVFKRIIFVYHFIIPSRKRAVCSTPKPVLLCTIIFNIF